MWHYGSKVLQTNILCNLLSCQSRITAMFIRMNEWAAESETTRLPTTKTSYERLHTSALHVTIFHSMTGTSHE